MHIEVIQYECCNIRLCNDIPGVHILAVSCHGEDSKGKVAHRKFWAVENFLKCFLCVGYIKNAKFEVKPFVQK